MTTTRTSAVRVYSDLRWSVLPVDGSTKKPLIPWKCFQHRRPTGFELHNWASAYPNSGIAVITGSISGIVVLDVDGEEGVEEARRRGIVKTPTVATPRGGMHFYFKWPPDLLPFKNSVKLGYSHRLDVRGDAAYVVAPFTQRSDGKKYEWVEDPVRTPIADAPGWFMRMLKKLAATEAVKRASGPIRAALKGSPGLDALIARLPERLQQCVREGHDLESFPSRSECDMAVVVALIAEGATETDIETIFQALPIGEKYREPDERGHYLERTLQNAYGRIRDVRIRYADPIRSGEAMMSHDGTRLHVALVDESNGEWIRCGITMPDAQRDKSAKWKNVPARWTSFFASVGLDAPLTYEDVCSSSRKLIGRRIRIEVDHKGSRTNPVVGFHKIN